MPYLDDSIFALDRDLSVQVTINGRLVGAGLADREGNITDIDIDFQLDQLPPTATINLVEVPDWVERQQTVEIDAGYDGNLQRIFTGRVKRRRHTVQGDVIDCVGRTAKLTQPFRSKAKSFVATPADQAIIDILDDVGFVPPDEQYTLDSTLSSWTLGTVKTAVLDAMAASDMIQKISEVDGHRVFETPTGVLVIRALLEAPAPNGFRSYTTDGPDRTAITTILLDDSTIDTDAALGDDAARQQRSQSITPSDSGRLEEFSFWVKKVGTPTDRLRVRVYADDNGNPTGNLLGGADIRPGSILSGSYMKFTFRMVNNIQLQANTTYHVVIDRTGAVDAANYYQIGLDTGGGYVGGEAKVFDGASWSSAGGDYTFEAVIHQYATARIVDISDDEDEDQVKKKVIVKGATLESTDAEGNEIQTQIEQEAVTLSTDLIEGDPEYYSMTYQNDLIDTDEKAAEVALRLLDKFHRILDSIELVVPFDPRVALGSTISLNDPTITNKTGNWWIRGYRHSIGGGTIATHLSLYGGDQSGTTGLLAPAPDFSYIIERELVGNAVQAVVSFFDESSDLDGEIANYQWTDDYLGGAMNESGSHLTSITRAYDPNVDEEVTVTLTVTDDSGLTRSIDKTIDTTTNNDEVYAPVIACAAGNTCMATFDGGLSWVDQATPSGNAKVSEVTFDLQPDSPMIVLFGTDTGRIYRSDDDMQTLVEVLDTGNEITDIHKDILVRRFIWASTLDGRIYRSSDFGATWELYVDFNDPQLFGAPPGFTIETKTITGLGLNWESRHLFANGGRADVPESWAQVHWLGDPPWKWEPQTTQEDLDNSGIGPSASTNPTAAGLTSYLEAGDLGFLFQDRNPRYIYTRRWTEEPAEYENGTGLPTGVDGVDVTGNNNRLQLFGLVMDDKNFYRCDDGVNWETLQDVLPGTASNRPHGLTNVNAWRDVFLCAMDEGIAKSIDYGETWDFLRPAPAPISTTWPAGAIGYEVAIEYRRPRRVDLLLSVYSPTPNKTFTLRREGAGGWTKMSEDATSYPIVRLYRFPGMGDTAFRCRSTGSMYNGWLTLQRSIDQGATWVDTTVERCPGVTRAPDGTLYALGSGGDDRAHRVYRSQDDGASWEEVFNDTATDVFGNFTWYNRIEADPQNPDRVAAFGWDGNGNQQVFLISLDATLGAAATYSRVEPTMTDTAEKSALGLAFGQNDRVFVTYEDSTGQQVFIESSDNNGSTWTLRKTVPSSGNEAPRELFRAAMDIYFAKKATAGEDNFLRSRDNGQTWGALPDPANPGQAVVLIWDARFNMLYTGEENPNSNVRFMVNPSTVGEWQDISAGIEAATGETDNRVCSEGMAILGD